MPSPFHGIETASRALRAFQRAMDVTGHNIANANTRGYTRQTVDMETSPYISYWQNGQRSLGTGVNIGSINRVRDLFLESRLQAAMSQGNTYSTVAAEVGGILSLMNEPGPDGITSALGKFFDGWSGAASNPNDPAFKLQLQQAANTLTSRIRNTYTQLQSSSTNIVAEIQSGITQVNNLAQRIADLNVQIREQLATGGQPNDLLDTRDQAVRDLSQLVNINVNQNQDGTVNIVSSEFTLVDTAGARQMPTNVDTATGSITGWLVPIHVRSGKLAGLMQSAGFYSREMTNLDTLANNLRSQINSVHQLGMNQNGNTGVNFFNDAVPQTGAADFALSSAVAADYKEISLGIADNSGGSPAYWAGESGLALTIANLRTSSVPGLGNRGFVDFHKDNVSRLGSEQSYFSAAMDTQDSMVGQIEEQQQSVSGVSLDDEMANLLRFQRSYQAAAKLLTIFDQVTEDLIGMLRR